MVEQILREQGQELVVQEPPSRETWGRTPEAKANLDANLALLGQL